MSTGLSSSPSNPTDIYHEIGPFDFHLSSEGLNIREIASGREHQFTIREALCLLQFVRSPGVAGLVNRAWLAEQHAAALAETSEDADDETRHKRHAGLRAA